MYSNSRVYLLVPFHHRDPGPDGLGIGPNRIQPEFVLVRVPGELWMLIPASPECLRVQRGLAT